MNKNPKIKDMVTTALLIAICFIATWINIPNPLASQGEGLMHLGGVVLMISALYLGPYTGAVVGSVGMGLFDLVWGPIWAPGTVVIRFIMGLIIGVLAKGRS